MTVYVYTRLTKRCPVQSGNRKRRDLMELWDDLISLCLFPCSSLSTRNMHILSPEVAVALGYFFLVTSLAIPLFRCDTSCLSILFYIDSILESFLNCYVISGVQLNMGIWFFFVVTRLKCFFFTKVVIQLFQLMLSDQSIKL